MMRRAIQLARFGEGFTSPNPMVGAVVCAPDGRIIGEGWHRRCGQAHAEVNAINSVSDADRTLLPESTIYVTLEPCSHYGKTPPCAELLIRQRLRRVVIGSLDPFPEVSGRGAEMIRKAGATVEVGLMEKECKAINKRFFTAHTLKRPHILLKWARSEDGFIASPAGFPRAIFSTPLTTMAVHRLRAISDAIMVGVNTIIADNPKLDTRLWPGTDPRPVTMDSLRLPREALIMARSPILRRPNEPLGQFLNRLYKEEKITSLMVEGGTMTLQEFLNEGLFDEVRVEVSPIRLRNGIPAPDLPLNLTPFIEYPT
ncbi:MAG: bifunctional diaminohydroxyphosphoribosylaminopyrimidine deaminase/5-amino-6-(5-phosphoribosylamino)uracil reductase RibD [Muribaculaceae bacterium]|nr:bifunctional diaminohydroxyphosphoribosylaminopyrimidine deaminase/5-amino-6-(5-phosphoribosylamino)uracil reductase RibD [Muribaculaceae bacterium]